MADIEKNIIIKADAERVYKTLLDVTNYPKIAPGVQTVMPMGRPDPRKVGGPLGSRWVRRGNVGSATSGSAGHQDLPGDI